jgi:hypothetical protein
MCWLFIIRSLVFGFTMPVTEINEFIDLRQFINTYK